MKQLSLGPFRVPEGRSSCLRTEQIGYNGGQEAFHETMKLNTSRAYTELYGERGAETQYVGGWDGQKKGIDQVRDRS